MSKDYEILLSKYNRLVARTSDLQEQMNTKSRQWEDREAEIKKTMFHVNELCVSILAKDQTEMVLGEEYTWTKLPPDQLVQKALKSFAVYCQRKTEILRKTMDIAEARGMEVEGLKDQIERMLKRIPTSETTVDDIVKAAEKETQLNGARNKADVTLRELAKTGAIEMVLDEGDDVTIVDGTEEQLIQISEKKKLTPVSLPVYDSRKKMEKRQEKRDVLAHMIDLSDMENQMSNAMWHIVEVIGKDGHSKYACIQEDVLATFSEEKDSRVKGGMISLAQMGIVSKEAVSSLPLSPRMSVYRLSDIGCRLYEKKFKKKPVLSELDKIVAEHDNAEHGYGILDVAKVLSDSGRYKDVSCFNRQRAIKLEGGGSFIPDIICVPANAKYEEYFEYERGLHTQSDFNVKCDKMVKITRFMNFVVPNMDVLTKLLQPKLDAWIEKRGVASLEQIKIRATIARTLRDAEDLKSIQAWLLVYDLSRGAAPIKSPQITEASKTAE